MPILPPHRAMMNHKNYRLISLEELDIERLCRNFNTVARKATNGREITLSLTAEVFLDIKNITISDKERERILSHTLLMDVYNAYFDSDIVPIIINLIDNFQEKLEDIMRRFHQQNRKSKHRISNGVNQRIRYRHYH